MHQPPAASQYYHNFRSINFGQSQFVWCVMLLNRWARKELRRGDLGTLAELANGCGWGDPIPIE